MGDGSNLGVRRLAGQVPGGAVVQALQPIDEYARLVQQRVAEAAAQANAATGGQLGGAFRAVVAPGTGFIRGPGESLAAPAAAPADGQPAPAPAPPAGPTYLEEPPTTPTADVQKQLDTSKQYAASAFGGAAAEAPAFKPMMVGVGKLKLPEEYATGVGQQQTALEKLQAEMVAEEPQIAKLEKAYETEAAKYRSGLDTLRGQRKELVGKREAQVAQERQALEQAQNFDANRVYTQLAQKPLELGALALMSGIVQGLQGYAGDDKPNAIMQQVEAAAKRDLTNQVEQYRRMLQGQEFTRNAFIEARQNLADDQQALQVATMATLDQYTKGLEWAKARLMRAADRSAVDRSIGQLNMEKGKALADMNQKQAELSLQAQHYNQAAQLEAERAKNAYDQAMLRFGAERMMKANDIVGQYARSDKGEALEKDLSQIARTGDAIAQAVGNGRDINELLDKGFLQLVQENLIAQGAKITTSKDASPVLNAFTTRMASYLTGLDPVKAQVMREVQNLFVSHLRQEAGKAQSVQEVANNLAAAGLNTPDGILRFINRKLVDNENIIEGYHRAALRSGDEAQAAAWDNYFKPSILAARAPFEAIREQEKKADELVRKAAQQGKR